MPAVLSLACPSEYIVNQNHLSYNLPDDVFAPGEIKPSRPRKKSITKKTDPSAKKRRLESSGVEVCHPAN